jgi:hypothetical protein
MTAQVNDSFRYRDTEYTLAGISEGELFDISAFGLELDRFCSACYRGYVALFAVTQNRLVLDALRVRLKNSGEVPVINGVKPFLEYGKPHYEGLDYRLEYSGGVLLANGFIDSLYVHMGFHSAWKFETVIELIFDAGILKKEIDRSNRMAEIREMVVNFRNESDATRAPVKTSITRFVERAFDRTYRMSGT